MHDRGGGRRLLDEELAEKLPPLAVLWADAAYTGRLRSFGRTTSAAGGWRYLAIRIGSSLALRTGAETARLPGAAEEVVERTFA
jgi:hypothetical protein